MHFVDEVKIHLSAGNGGNGCCSFRREKYIPFGGPDGGNGGRGGSVYIKVQSNLSTLNQFRYKRHFKAPNGGNGQNKNRSGKDGVDLVLEVPLGTQVFSEDKNILFFDLTQENEKILIVEGGIGGLGNVNFKSSTNQKPMRADDGTPGEERWIILKLKLIADVGLIGLPNAGKSTFLKATTRANPKIANYPFTTLNPQLGVLYYNDRELVIADIPGIIKNAHKGAGLGHKFLAHVERCKVFIHLIDASQQNVVQTYKTIRNEIEKYNKLLIQKTEIIVLNKIDLLDEEEIERKQEMLRNITGRDVLTISGINMTNLNILTNKLFEIV